MSKINLEEDKKKHRLGALALLFPIAYNLADAVSMVAMGITVSGEAEVEIPEIDFFFFECFGFLVISIFVWLYMLIAKKHVYNPFNKAELPHIGAATCETMGTLTFVFAVGINPKKDTLIERFHAQEKKRKDLIKSPDKIYVGQELIVPLR